MKKKNGNIVLPVTALTPEQIAKVVAIAETNMISKTAVLRQAIAQFIDQPEDTIEPYIDRNYGQAVAFTNVYCPPATATALDGLAEKFDKPRNQIIRGAVAKFLENQ